MKNQNAFDPFKSGVSSTTGYRPITDVLKTGSTGFKHEQMNAEMKQIQKDRKAEYEDHVEDREVVVFNVSNVQNKNINAIFAAYDKD